MKTYKSTFSLTLVAYTSICVTNSVSCPLKLDATQPKNNNTLYEKNIVITTSLPDAPDSSIQNKYG